MENLNQMTQTQTYTVKVLKTRGPRKGELWAPGQGGGRVLGNVQGTDSNTAGVAAGTNGARMTMTPQRGLGANTVANLSKVKRVADAQYKADRRAAALDRLAGL